MAFDCGGWFGLSCLQIVMPSGLIGEAMIATIIIISKYTYGRCTTTWSIGSRGDCK